MNDVLKTLNSKVENIQSRLSSLELIVQEENEKTFGELMESIEWLKTSLSCIIEKSNKDVKKKMASPDKRALVFYGIKGRTKKTQGT